MDHELIELDRDVIHFEYNGYQVLNEPNNYYCHGCGIMQPGELKPIRHHDVVVNSPLDISSMKCSRCDNFIVTVTRLTNCRKCFLLYIVDETKQELARDRLSSP